MADVRFQLGDFAAQVAAGSRRSAWWRVGYAIGRIAGLFALSFVVVSAGLLALRLFG